MARKILITGGEGQLGKALQRGLSEKFKLLSTSRKTPSGEINNQKIQKMDLTDKNNISDILISFNIRTHLN